MIPIEEFIDKVEGEFEDMEPGKLMPESVIREHFTWDSINALIFIAHVNVEYDVVSVESPITGVYCTCKSGARVVGSCSHVASILWYLGFARHEDYQPKQTGLQGCLDAGEEVSDSDTDSS